MSSPKDDITPQSAVDIERKGLNLTSHVVLQLFSNRIAIN